MSLTDRFVKYLEKNTHVSDKWQQSTTVDKRKLQNLAFDNGYTYEDVQAAFKALDEKVFIGSWWNRERRVVEYIFYPMTEEEIKFREDADAWFEAL